MREISIVVTHITTLCKCGEWISQKHVIEADGLRHQKIT